MDEMDRDVLDAEPRVEGERVHVLLGRLTGVLERPGDRLLPELAVVRRHVRAAAVVFIARDRVVVVAVDRRDLALLYEGANVVWIGPVADQVPAAIDPLDAECLYALERSLQGGEICVDVRDNRYVAVHIRTLSIDRRRFNRYTYIDVRRSGAGSQAEAGGR
jgi:hypothetical protein